MGWFLGFCKWSGRCPHDLEVGLFTVVLVWAVVRLRGGLMKWSQLRGVRFLTFCFMFLILITQIIRPVIMIVHVLVGWCIWTSEF